MSWKKHFQVVPTNKVKSTAIPHNDERGPASTGSKYASWLPEIYSGQPNRIERYTQYDQMDMDSEINAALDTIADFCTQIDDNKDQPLQIVFNEDPTETEAELLDTTLRQWIRMNEFKRRLWRIMRNVIKYGDQFFIRDPETYEWLWVDHTKVQSLIADEAAGKEPIQYLVKDLDLNIAAKTATSNNSSVGTASQYNSGFGGSQMVQSNMQLTSSLTPSVNGRFGGHSEQVVPVDAEHVIHISMSEGMDNNWPFGCSVLESVFKTYKQKELLEDAMIIYRIQRAPERRIFYIDVGNMPAHKAMAHVERIKNEIHQRQIPNRNGGGSSVLDASYNPLSQLEDYFFAQGSDGRGSKVETLPGGQSVGEVNDLQYFSNKLFRGLRIPSSYLPTGNDDGGQQYTDGRVGTAYIQEWRFSKYCQRLQNIVSPIIDREFKLFLKKKGILIHPQLFTLAFNEPQNFGEFKRMEVDSQRLNLYQQVSGITWMSKRFAGIRYLGMTEDELLENERMWKEENISKIKSKSPSDSDDSGLRDVGVGGGGGGLDFGGGGGDLDLGGDDGGDLGGGDDGSQSPISGGEGGDAGGGEAPTL